MILKETTYCSSSTIPTYCTSIAVAINRSSRAQQNIWHCGQLVCVAGSVRCWKFPRKISEFDRRVEFGGCNISLKSSETLLAASSNGGPLFCFSGLCQLEFRALATINICMISLVRDLCSVGVWFKKQFNCTPFKTTTVRYITFPDSMIQCPTWSRSKRVSCACVTQCCNQHCSCHAAISTASIADWSEQPTRLLTRNDVAVTNVLRSMHNRTL